MDVIIIDPNIKILEKKKEEEKKEEEKKEEEKKEEEKKKEEKKKEEKKKEEIKIIGQGTNGQIYPSQINGRCIKISSLFEEGTNNEILFSSSSLRELVFYKSIRHPTIPKFYNVWIQKNYLCLEMDKCDCSIIHWIRNTPYKDRISNFNNIFGLLFRFLAWIHKYNIIHGDIKSTNIVMVENTPKFIDFGSSYKKSDNYYRTWTTYWYVSPEDAVEENIGIHNDIWAMGLLMYYYIVRCYPSYIIDFESLEDVKNYYSDCQEDIQINDKIPIYIKTIIDNCLLYDSSKRWTAINARDYLIAAPSYRVNINKSISYYTNITINYIENIKYPITDNEKIICGFMDNHLSNPQIDEEIPNIILDIPNYKSIFIKILQSIFMDY